MPPTLSYRNHAGPLGPYRDKRTVDISAADFVDDRGFTVQAAEAGSLTYRTLYGDADETEAGLAAGHTIAGPGGIPVVCRAVRATSSVGSIVIGLL